MEGKTNSETPEEKPVTLALKVALLSKDPIRGPATSACSMPASAAEKALTDSSEREEIPISSVLLAKIERTIVKTTLIERRTKSRA